MRIFAHEERSGLVDGGDRYGEPRLYIEFKRLARSPEGHDDSAK